MRFSLGLCVCVSVCVVNSARADDELASELRVDRCPEAKAPGDTEVETAEEQEARRLQEAGDDYDRGLVLYEEGDYEGAVDAFVSSYCTKAHPAAFYNIAQSHERLLNFERSVQYFERYVAETKEENANTKKARLRAEVLRKLPAQLRIATVPPGASITIRNKAGIVARGKANALSPIEVRQGQYTMHVEKPGFEAIVQELSTKPGQPYSYYLSLEPEETPMQITVSPGNARIFVDKRLVGVGTYSESLPLGSYEIMVEAPKRETSTRVVQLTAGKRSNQVIHLNAPLRSGRLELLIASGVGLGIGGSFAVSNIFGQETAISAAAGLATTAVGFGGAYYGIPETISRGDAWYLIESSVIGAFELGLIGRYIACDQETELGVTIETCDDEIKTGAAITGAIAGVLSATATRSNLQLTTGDSALVASGAFWGMTSGAFFYAIFDDDYRLRDPLLFVGLNLGLVASAGLVANGEVSLRRVAVIDLAGMGGLIGGAGLALALAREGDQLQHYSFLGLISGLVGGTFLTRSLDDNASANSPGTSLSLSPGLSSARDVDGKSVMSLGLSATF